MIEKLGPVNLKIDKEKNFSDSIRSAGIYSRDEIRDAKYNKFSRYGSILDPYNRMTDNIEYLFFVKPDLHIMSPTRGKLNPELENETFFVDLKERYPEVIDQLQVSASNDKLPFSRLLSFAVNSVLETPAVTLGTMDTPATIYGTAYDYLQDGEASDENYDFSLEFRDSKALEVYHFFKAYSEYQILKKYGRVTPPDIDKYTIGKRLHNTMGIFKIWVSLDDMKTITYFSYFTGVIPLSVPRDSFSNSTFSDGLTFSINFKTAFVDDMDPKIIYDFNRLVYPYYSSLTKDILPYDVINDQVNGELVNCPYIVVNNNPTSEYNGKKRYELVWR